jgi:hypothetical protein
VREKKVKSKKKVITCRANLARRLDAIHETDEDKEPSQGQGQNNL